MIAMLDMVATITTILAVGEDVAALGGGPPPQPIVGGTTAEACDFPADVYIGNGGANCTASLVHPRVLITAAHCLGGLGLAGFGESSSSPQMTVGIQHCEAHPQYYDWGIDLAFCVLAEDAPEVAMVPVIMGCEAEELMPGREAVVAGFGQSNEASGTGGGLKRFTSNTIDYTQGGRIYLLGNGNGSCYGDSGGPAYIQLADGSWRVFAAVQGPHPQAPPLGCGFGGTYTLIHTEMEWIESASGYDITPCFDADGSWNPDERCTEFPTELHGFGGTWNDLCAAGPLSGPGASCGPALPDLDPDPDGGGESGGSMDTGHLPPDSTTGHDVSDTGATTTAADDDTEPLPDPGEGGAPELDVDADDPALPPAYGQTGRAPGCRIAAPTPPGRAWWCLLLPIAAIFGQRRRPAAPARRAPTARTAPLRPHPPRATPRRD